MSDRVLALKVADGVAFSAATIASIDPEGQWVDQFISAVLHGPYRRIQIGPAATLVDMGHGHQFVVVRHEQGIGVMARIELELAGGAVDLDVRERVETTEAVDPRCIQ